MRLSVDAIKELLLHADQEVRDTAAFYLAKVNPPDADVMRQVIQAKDDAQLDRWDERAAGRFDGLGGAGADRRRMRFGRSRRHRGSPADGKSSLIGRRRVGKVDAGPLLGGSIGLIDDRGSPRPCDGTGPRCRA